MKAEQQTLRNLSRLFLYFMRYTKKASRHTLKAYKTDLGSLLGFEWEPEDAAEDNFFLKSKSSLFSLKIHNKKKLAEIIKSSIENNSAKYFKLSNSSKNRKLAAAKSFIKWLAEENYIKEDFRHLFKSPKVSVRIPYFLSIDEIFSIMDMLQKEKSSPESTEAKALFCLLYGGGLRVSEACRIKNRDIDWSARLLRVKGKGGKERLAPLPDKAFAYIKLLKTNQIYLFGAKPLSERRAYDIIRSIGKKAGLLKTLHPHALRHSFATHVLAGGADLRALQELLGHKSLTATQKYTHLNLARLAQTLENFHPLTEKNSPFCREASS